MKFDYKRLFIWFLVYYLIHDPVKELFLYGSTDIYKIFIDGKMTILGITNVFSFYFFSLIAYAGFYYFFPSKRWWLFSGTMFLAMVIPICIRYLVQEILMQLFFGFTNYHKSFTLLMYFRDHFYFIFSYMILGVFFYLMQVSNFRDRKEQELALVNHETELALLKSQINPHFLLNSLNNIYSLIYHKSTDALTAVEKLTDILKYALYDKRKFVELSEELNYLDSFINLQLMRFDFDINYNINISEKVKELLIPQLLLIPLAENIFKHGDMTQSPAFVIDISEQTGNIIIEVSNAISDITKVEVGGIGISNIKKRLELIYKDNYRFEVDQYSEKYSVTIFIPTS